MKKYLLGLFAFALAISLSSFTAKDDAKASTFTAKWFHFVGDASVPADLIDASKYELDNFDGSDNTFCESTTEQYRCEILIEPQTLNPSRPDLSAEIEAEVKRVDAVE